MSNKNKLVYLKYPSEAVLILPDDVIIVKTKKGTRKISPYKWWINLYTPVGEDAELWERKPHDGRKHIEWCDVVAVERLIATNEITEGEKGDF